MDVETAPGQATRPRTGLTPFVLTSVVASAVGAVVAIMFDNLGVAIAGAIADRFPVLFHNDVVLRSEGSDLALAGGTALTLIAGAVFLTLYPGSRRHDAARLTVLWIVLHCFRQGFTPLATLPISSDSGVARAYAALDVPAGLELVISAAGVVGLLSVALASAPAFLAYAHHSKLISTPSRRFVFTAQLALIPGVVGPLVALPLFLPDRGTGLIESLPFLGLFTVATVLASIGVQNVRIVDNAERQGWSWLPLGWLLFLALVNQLLLRRGVVIPPSLDAPFIDTR